MRPINFVQQVYKSRRDDGRMFNSEVGVQEVTTTDPNKNRFRAYVMNGWGGGVQCFRDTSEEAMSEIDRLWSRLHG